MNKKIRQPFQNIQGIGFVFILLLFLTGCASMHRYNNSNVRSKNDPPPPFWATGTDLGVALTAPFSQSPVFGGAQGLLISGICLLDLPVAIVGDTIFLPFDTHACLKHWLNENTVNN